MTETTQATNSISSLQRARAAYRPKLPAVFARNGMTVQAVDGDRTESVADQAAIRDLFPSTYGLPLVRFSAAPKPAERP